MVALSSHLRNVPGRTLYAEVRHLGRVRLQRRARPPLRRAARAGADRAARGGARTLADPHDPPRDRGGRSAGGAHGLRSGQDPEMGGEERDHGAHLALDREPIQEAISRFFDLPIFVVLGMALPWEGWLELGWGGILLVAAVLLLRRLPAVLALRPLLGPLRSGGKDVLFLGWFGPIGAAALYYAAFSYRETGIEAAWTVGSLVICASVVVHGVSATPLTKLYGSLPKNA
jgi:hypothetical protein